MNDNLPTLHDKTDELLLRGLSDAMRRLRGSPGHIGQTAETLAGRPPVPADAAGQAGQGGNISGSESGGVKT